MRYAVLLLLLSHLSYSQSIRGIVASLENKKPVSFANIILKNKDGIIISYGHSDKAGKYSIHNDKYGVFALVISSIGFESRVLEITIDKKDIEVDVVLQKKTFELEEVVIKAELPMLIKKDTVTFKAKYYAKGDEQTVEDLLKRIPGLDINSAGTISVGNKEIEKLMIDGDDFFEKGYKILSKNMPAFPIEEIEVLNKYSNNRLLKGVEESNKVALNLKLKEKSKHVWFGNIEGATNFKSRYDFRGNLMNFEKKAKYYFLSSINNIGSDAVGDIANLINPFRVNQTASIGDNQQTKRLIGLSTTTLNFKKSRTNFNSAELISLNAIFNPSKKVKIKTLAFINLDEQYFFRNNVDVVVAGETKFINTEDFKLRNGKMIGFGKLNFVYDISKEKIVEGTTKYSIGGVDGISNLIFNGDETSEYLKDKNILFDQKITYSNKLKNKKVLLITARFIDEKVAQDYSYDNFLYKDLLPTYINANNMQQQSTNRMQFAGFESHLLDRNKKGNLFELKFGNEYRVDRLNSAFTLLENTTVLGVPKGFQNDVKYQTNDLYIKTKYRYKLGKLPIVGRLGVHQLFNVFNHDSKLETQGAFFVNPSIGIDWKINDNNKVSSSYSYNTTNAGILDVYNNYVLTNFRSFYKGTGEFNQLNLSTLYFNYELGNWGDSFFANISTIYNKDFDFFSSNTLISQNFTQSERIIIKDRVFFNISSSVDYFFKSISSNLKLKSGYTKSNYKNIINNSNLREINQNSYNLGLELRSGFKGFFNYHIGTKWTSSKIETLSFSNSFVDNISFLDLSFIFNEKFNAKIQSERYLFGRLDKENNTYYFLDFYAEYTVKKNKLTLALTGKNILNTEKFTTFSISDIGSSRSEYKLLERFVLLKVEYRF